MDKVRSTIRQIYRDWSVEGAPERDLTYGRVLEDVRKHFPTPFHPSGRRYRFLTPGSGLGRLPWELAQLGFDSEGNEFSFYMLVASSFVLNYVNRIGQYKIYPFVHSTMNMLASLDNCRSVSVPDVDPSSVANSNSAFSMAAGDFLEIYETSSDYDCICCCFFLDTGHNIISYLEKIFSLLVPGGIFIHFGPLLYHFADQFEHHSIELSWDEVRSVILQLGFEIVSEDSVRNVPYTGNSHSMLSINYNCTYLVGRKPLA
jgi:carnosine N-methyltransferase